MRRATIALLAATSLLSACGGDSEAAPATTTPAVDNHQVCIDAGEVIVDAQIPPGAVFVAGDSALQVRALATDTISQLEELEGDGSVQAGVDAVVDALTAIEGVSLGEPMGWAGLRRPLTSAVTALQSVCASDADVPDFLNP